MCTGLELIIFPSAGNERGRDSTLGERKLEGHVASMYAKICFTELLHTHGAVVFGQIQAQICGL